MDKDSLMTEQEQRQKVIDIALTWEKTRYHHAARVKGVGVDCVNFVAAVYEEAGLVPHMVFPYYPPDFMNHRSEEKILNVILQYAVPVETPGPGDIALFKFGRSGSHVAIVIEWPLIIHAYADIGVVVRSDVERIERLKTRLMGCYSFWGKK